MTDLVELRARMERLQDRNSELRLASIRPAEVIALLDVAEAAIALYDINPYQRDQDDWDRLGQSLARLKETP